MLVTASEEMRLLPATRRALREDLGITPQGARQRHVAVDPVVARRPKPKSMDAFYAEFHAALAAGEIPVLQPTEIRGV